MDHALSTQFTLTLSAFLGQNMTKVVMFKLEAARTRFLETFCSAFIAFHLRHCNLLLRIGLILDSKAYKFSDLVS